jgi:hypothetical protein
MKITIVVDLPDESIIKRADEVRSWPEAEGSAVLYYGDLVDSLTRAVESQSAEIARLNMLVESLNALMDDAY